MSIIPARILASSFCLSVYWYWFFPFGNKSFIFDKNAHLLIGLFPSIVETDSDIASALSWIFWDMSLSFSLTKFLTFWGCDNFSFSTRALFAFDTKLSEFTKAVRDSNSCESFSPNVSTGISILLKLLTLSDIFLYEPLIYLYQVGRHL